MIYDIYKTKISNEKNNGNTTSDENQTECETSSVEEDEETSAWQRAIKAHARKKTKNLASDDVYNHSSIPVEIVNYLKDKSGYIQGELDLKANDMDVEDKNRPDIHKNTENMLSWWKENRLRYPVLSVMARDYLAISASAVPCESTFSGGRRTNRWDRAG